MDCFPLTVFRERDFFVSLVGNRVSPVTKRQCERRRIRISCIRAVTYYVIREKVRRGIRFSAAVSLVSYKFLRSIKVIQ